MNLPNKITIARMCFAPFIALSIFLESPLFAGILFIIVMLTDGIDGYLARKRNEVTKLGKILDPLADKVIIITALFSVFLKYDYITISELFLFFTRDILVLIGLPFYFIKKEGKKEMSALFLGKVVTVVQIITLFFIILDFKGQEILVLITFILGILAAGEYSYVYFFKKEPHSPVEGLDGPESG